MRSIFLTILTLSTFSSFIFAESDHDHSHGHEEHSEAEHSDDKHNHNEEKKHKKSEDHDDHSEGEHDHDDHKPEEAHGHGHGHEDEAFGKGKAILEVRNEGKKFKLSAKSEKLLGIRTNFLEPRSDSTFKVPSGAVVRYQNHLGVFIKHDGWFQLIELKKVIPLKDYTLIKSSELQKNSQIVISGVPLLRVAHLQASGQGGKGHAH